MSENTAVAVQEPAKLDELMLAMDVVDTLRHQQDLVDHALSEEQRDAALIARIKKIYADQGIAVTDAVIAEGVEALKKDRFLYKPPAVRFSVRLARLYVDRWRWAKRGAVVAALAGGAWLSYELPQQWAQRERSAAAHARMDEVNGRLATAAERLGQTQRAQASAHLPNQSRAAGERLLADARAESSRAEQAIAQANSVATATQLSAAPTADELERVLAPLLMPIEEAEQALQRADAKLADLGQLGGLADALTRARAAFAGASLASAARSQIDDIQEQAQQAIAVGDLALARGRIDRLNELATTVNLAYELRIVSRPDQQSGVWRHPADNPRARNHYIVVEAIGADGRPVELPVTSEEDQVTRRVSRFAVRVPERVYEAVRADKQDNGLIDSPLFAIKRRGELEPQYRVAVAGGAITAW